MDDCVNYDKCPVCYRCRAAAPAIHEKCNQCRFGQTLCKHNDFKIGLVIKRKNFKPVLSYETKEEFRALMSNSSNEVKSDREG